MLQLIASLPIHWEHIYAYACMYIYIYLCAYISHQFAFKGRRIDNIGTRFFFFNYFNRRVIQRGPKVENVQVFWGSFTLNQAG